MPCGQREHLKTEARSTWVHIATKRHDSPREACFASLPCCNLGSILLPGDLLADGVSLHLIKVRSVGANKVEEFAPQQLTSQ